MGRTDIGLQGCFQESPSDPHVALREVLLRNPSPEPKTSAEHADSPQDAGKKALNALASRGYALMTLSAPFDNLEFLEFGATLGRLLPEHDPDTKRFTENSAILNLYSEQGYTTNAASQPFSTDYLTLHSESSRSPLRYQPRYIALMCIEPGDAASAAQTLIVPMAGVAARCSNECLRKLRTMRYRNAPDAPPIVRDSDTAPVFSFRDFGKSALAWVATGSAVGDPKQGNAALRELLAALYRADGSVGLTWQSGLLMVLDNQRVFHGRTAGAPTPTTDRRHLKRIRIGEHQE